MRIRSVVSDQLPPGNYLEPRLSYDAKRIVFYWNEMGAPISLNAGFLDYKDAPNPYDCQNPCTAPELQGTAMQGHAGTRWLTPHWGYTSPGNSTALISPTLL